MTTALVDTSVLLKWFHSEGESELAAARAIRDANTRGDLDVRVIDLALYELGNMLLKRLHWPASDIADQLDDLVAICGAPIAPASVWLRDAAAVAAAQRMTFYDAAWAATARALSIPLVSADRKLVSCGLALTPAAAARQLQLA